MRKMHFRSPSAEMIRQSQQNAIPSGADEQLRLTPFVDDFERIRLQTTIRKIKDDFEIGLTSKKEIANDELAYEMNFADIVKDLDRKLMESAAPEQLILQSNPEYQQPKHADELTLQQ